MKRLNGLLGMAKKMLAQKRGQTSKSLTDILVTVILAVALIPLIAVNIAGAQNLTAAQTTLLAIVPTLLVVGVIVLVARKSGL